MSNKVFTLVWAKILDSSVWMESKETRLVWVTMLLMKDADGVVTAAVSGLAHRARVTVEECEAALRVLEGPDGMDSSGVLGGRRVVKVKGGWRIVNSDEYRFSSEAKREFWRLQKAEQRVGIGKGEGKRERRKYPQAIFGAPQSLEEKLVEDAGNREKGNDDGGNRVRAE